MKKVRVLAMAGSVALMMMAAPGVQAQGAPASGAQPQTRRFRGEKIGTRVGGHDLGYFGIARQYLQGN